MTLEVLCVTMHQKDMTKFDSMNIQSDVVFANQADDFRYDECCIDGMRAKMITTAYRGVGNNRNMALLHATADLILFSDDDVVYNDGYAEMIKEAFNGIPDADIILFNLETVGNAFSRRFHNRVFRIGMHNVMNYGFPRVAARKSSIEKANLSVSMLFGGGAKYCAGEDNLFLTSALNKGLKLYAHTSVIGSTQSTESTWFKGYNEKYFFDNGAWLEASFPLMKHVLHWYFVWKFFSKTPLRRFDIVKLHYAGMNAFKKGISYEEWKNAIGTIT